MRLACQEKIWGSCEHIKELLDLAAMDEPVSAALQQEFHDIDDEETSLRMVFEASLRSDFQIGLMLRSSLQCGMNPLATCRKTFGGWWRMFRGAKLGEIAFASNRDLQAPHNAKPHLWSVYWPHGCSVWSAEEAPWCVAHYRPFKEVWDKA